MKYTLVGNITCLCLFIWQIGNTTTSVKYRVTFNYSLFTQCQRYNQVVLTARVE